MVIIPMTAMTHRHAPNTKHSEYTSHCVPTKLPKTQSRFCKVFPTNYSVKCAEGRSNMLISFILIVSLRWLQKLQCKCQSDNYVPVYLFIIFTFGLSNSLSCRHKLSVLGLHPACEQEYRVKSFIHSISDSTTWHQRCM